jgi:hypothetical protein
MVLGYMTRTQPPPTKQCERYTKLLVVGVVAIVGFGRNN